MSQDLDSGLSLYSTCNSHEDEFWTVVDGVSVLVSIKKYTSKHATLHTLDLGVSFFLAHCYKVGKPSPRAQPEKESV